MAYDPSVIRLPDPSTNPAGPGWASQSLGETVPAQSDSLNGGSVVAVYQGGNYWKLNLTYNSMPIEDYTVLGNFISQLRGPATPFYVQLPQYINPKTGAWTGTGIALGEGNITKISSDTIRVDSKASLGGSLTAGDMLKLSINDRIYKVIQVTEGATYFDYKLNAIIEGTVDGLTYLEPNDIKFKMVLQGDKPTENIDSSGLVQGFSLSLRGTVI